METVAVNCNSCGAPLEVGPGTNFVTCTHCGARLAVKRTTSSAYTELLEKLDRKTDAMAAQLAEITRQNEVERIDREWEQERRKYLIADKNGNTSIPTVGAGLLGAVVIGVFGVFWTVSASSAGAPAFFPLFGVMFTVLGVGMGIRTMMRAGEYSEAEARYNRRRATALVRKNERDPQPPPE